MNINSNGDTLEISVNDVMRVRAPVNLAEHFVGRDAFVGFTGGAGASADQQDILTWTMESVVPTGSSLFGNRVAETRPPIPPTSPPVPPPVSPPVAPTNSPVVSPTNAPSSAPTTVGQLAQSFWDWFLANVQDIEPSLDGVHDGTN